MTFDVQNALADLFDGYIHKTKTATGQLPAVELENDLPGWASALPVVSTDESSGLIYWQPVPNGDLALFNGMEQGLEVSLHRDLKAFYGSYWSNGIDCDSPVGPLYLLQVWNEEDLDILRENLLGHAFMKRKKNQPLTFFVAVGEGDNVVVIDNVSGEVFLEVPGRRPHKKIADNLAAFIRGITAA